MTKSTRITWLLLAAVLAAVGPVSAAEPNQAAATQRTAGESLENQPVGGRDGDDAGMGLEGWLRPLAALAAVVVLIFVLRAVLRRLTGAVRPGRKGVVDVLHRSAMAGRWELCLVRFGKRLLLVALGPHGPVTLSEMTDPAEAAALLAELDKPVETRATKENPIRQAAENIRSRLGGESKATK